MGKLDERIALARPSLIRRLTLRLHSGYGLITAVAISHQEAIIYFSGDYYHFRRQFGHTVVSRNFWEIPTLDKDLIAPLASALMSAVYAGYKHTKPKPIKTCASDYDCYAEEKAYNRILTVSNNRVRLFIDQEIVTFLRSTGHYDPQNRQTNLLRSHLRQTYSELTLMMMDAADTGKELRVPKKKSQTKSLEKLYGTKQIPLPFN